MKPAAYPIRRAELQDIQGIYELLHRFSTQNILLPRSIANLYGSAREFTVLEDRGRIIGCGALQIFSDNLGEVRSLAVAPEYARRGLGRQLVEKIEADARNLGLRRLMALTLNSEFFNQLGFEIVEMNTLPEKVWGVCINCPKFTHCDEIAMVKLL